MLFSQLTNWQVYKTSHFYFTINTLTLPKGIPKMAQHASIPQGQSNETEVTTRYTLFKSGTPAYQRMVNMIQNLVKAKTQEETPKCQQNEESSPQSGEDMNNAIELQESPQIYQYEEEGTDKDEEKVVERPNEVVFEQSEPQDQDKEQEKAVEQDQYVDDEQATEQYRVPKKAERNIQNKKKNNISQAKSTPKRNTAVQNRTNTRSNKSRQIQQRPKPSEGRSKNTSKTPQPKTQKPSPPQSKPIIQKKNAPVPKSTPKKRVRQQDRYEEGTIVIRIKPEKLSIPKPRAQKKQAAKPVVIDEDQIQSDAWPVMQKSKKPSIQWVGFRVAVPLVVSHKPTEKPQSSKRQKPLLEQRKSIEQIEQFTPKTLATKSKQMDVQMSFKNRVKMAKKTESMLDLGSYTLLKLVQEVYNRGLISEQLFIGFKQNHSPHYTKEFLSKFEKKGLKRFNFRLIQFTPLDHRRLSELLVNLYPTNYILNSESLPKDHSQGFIISSYGLSPKEYFDIYSQIDKISDIGWWSEIMSRQKERIHQGVLRRKEDEEYTQNSQKRMKFT